MYDLNVGQKVKKTSGYPFDWIIRAKFTNSGGEVRYVVELDRGRTGDMMHIFSPYQLEPRND